MQTLLPAIDLTPATLQRLQPRYPNRHVRTRGVNVLARGTVGERTTVLDPARLAVHLGVPLPQIPALQRQGCTTTVRGPTWETVFDHPVPHATAPAPTADPGADQHSVLLLHLPAGIDAGEVVIDSDPPEPAGVGWMRIAWGELHRPPRRPRR